MVPTGRDEAGLPSHATRDRPRRHYSRRVSLAFTFSGPRISTLCSRERNQLSVTGYYAPSIPHFDRSFPNKEFGLTPWPGEWWMLSLDQTKNTHACVLKTET